MTIREFSNSGIRLLTNQFIASSIRCFFYVLLVSERSVFTLLVLIRSITVPGFGLRLSFWKKVFLLGRRWLWGFARPLSRGRFWFLTGWAPCSFSDSSCRRCCQRNTRRDTGYLCYPLHTISAALIPVYCPAILLPSGRNVQESTLWCL